MSIVVLITNFNYACYIEQAIKSVLEQTLKPDKVIVIDDGSTDESVNIVKKYCNNSFILLEKNNAGQLSALNAAESLISSNDIVYLLDADDIYPTDHIEKTISEFDINTDFLFVNVERFIDGTEKTFIRNTNQDQELVFMPKTSNLTRCYHAWIGSPTSAIVLRGNLYKAILPYDDEIAWKVRADDVLIYASSIIGARKKYIPSLKVLYRTHNRNNFFGKFITNQQHIEREFAIERLFHRMCKRASISVQGSPALAYNEATFIPEKFLKKFFIPSLIKLRTKSLLWKITGN